MNIIFGFGEHHRQITIAFCNRMADAVLESDNPKDAAEKLAKDAGTWKYKGWKIVSLKRVEMLEIYEGAKIIVVEGSYSHIRDDHPMSPDGIACLDIPWCVTVCNDETWGKRVYVSA